MITNVGGNKKSLFPFLEQFYKKKYLGLIPLQYLFPDYFPLYPPFINHLSKSLQGQAKLSLSERIRFSSRAWILDPKTVEYWQV